MDFLTSSAFVVSIVLAIVLAAALISFAFASGFFTKEKTKFYNDDTIHDALYKALKRYAGLRDLEVLGKTTVEFNGESFSFDAILLSLYGTIGFKACYEQGEIYGEYKDENWVAVTKDGKRTYFANPCDNLAGSTKFFKELYAAEKVKAGFSDSFVVFPSKSAELFTGKRADVYTIKTMEEKLNGDKYQADKGADIKAMKAAIEKYTVK